MQSRQRPHRARAPKKRSRPTRMPSPSRHRISLSSSKRRADGEGRGEPPPSSMRARMSMLIGDKLGLVLALAVGSILSGFTEAATLALLAQIATSLARGAKHVHQHIGPFTIHASLPTLLKIAFG